VNPSGKATERTLLTVDQVEKNVAGIRGQLARFLDFDNTDTGSPREQRRVAHKLSAIEFMRDVGKYFTVNYMLAKESSSGYSSECFRPAALGGRESALRRLT
jgi:tyrosyl-tRNA synthetase